MQGVLVAGSALLLFLRFARQGRRACAVLMVVFALSIIGMSPLSAIAETVDVHLMLKDEGASIQYVQDGDGVSRLMAEGWSDMGVAWAAPDNSQEPVYVAHDEDAGRWCYTPAVDERDRLVRNGWTFEGIAWYSDDYRSVPVFMLYNRYAGTRYLTTNKAVRDEMVSYGWTFEGIACYALEPGPAADCRIDWWAGVPFEVSPIEAQQYTGNAVEPHVTVTLCDDLLTEGSDYTVSYSNNIEAGVASATVTGKGQYSSAKETVATFEIEAIERIDISSTSIKRIPNKTYTGKEIKPRVRVQDGSYELTEGIDYEVSYSDNVRVGDAKATITGIGSYEGTATVTFRIDAPTQEMHRLYNPNSGEHFYTAKAGERDALVKVGWVYEGIGWVAPVESKTPVYRLYNKIAGDHHYTMKAGERDALLKINGWVDEGIGWYSDDGEGTPLYRQYNPNAVTGSHNYTTNKKENDALVKQFGWKDEGIGWYGVAQRQVEVQAGSYYGTTSGWDNGIGYSYYSVELQLNEDGTYSCGLVTHYSEPCFPLGTWSNGTYKVAYGDSAKELIPSGAKLPSDGAYDAVIVIDSIPKYADGDIRMAGHMFYREDEDGSPIILVEVKGEVIELKPR